MKPITGALILVAFTVGTCSSFGSPVTSLVGSLIQLGCLTLAAKDPYWSGPYPKMWDIVAACGVISTLAALARYLLWMYGSP